METVAIPVKLPTFRVQIGIPDILFPVASAVLIFGMIYVICAHNAFGATLASLAMALSFIATWFELKARPMWMNSFEINSES